MANTWGVIVEARRQERRLVEEFMLGRLTFRRGAELIHVVHNVERSARVRLAKLDRDLKAALTEGERDG